MAELSVGDPANLFTDVGPVIDAEARNNIQHHLDRLNVEATLIARAPELKPELSGTFILPAAYEVKSLSNIKQEIFGPVLHVVRFSADKLDALVNEINALGYGLTLGIHTRIDDTMERVARRARVGNIYVNRNQIGAVVGVQPFGGEGLSGTGPKAGGPHYLPALTKRPRPQGDAPAPILQAEIMSIEKAAADEAWRACAPWNASDRKAALTGAMMLIPDLNASLAGKIETLLDELITTIELPGPTGESNTLKIRGRGVALCLGGGDQARQILTALAAGNTVISVECAEAQSISKALHQAGAPKGLLSIISADASHGLLLDNRVRAVIYDGGGSARAQIEQVLCERKGPVVPLLSSLDEPWRFATERTLTINTTAAGGDVRLLSLSE
jgi:RHH-type proline utilization regulon transcriptional repressor/proline dehydrogenase/delta 1-pyrroline-5-carboxylate dehydrogenase